MVAKIDSARAAGLDVGATMYPYPASGNNLGECFPDWATENGKLFDNLRDSGDARAHRARDDRHRTATPLCQLEGPTAYMIADFRKPENAKYEGKRLIDIADGDGEAVARDDRRARPVARAAIRRQDQLHDVARTNVAMQLRRPWVVIGTRRRRRTIPTARRASRIRAPTAPTRASSAATCASRSSLTLEDAVRKMTRRRRGAARPPRPRPGARRDVRRRRGVRPRDDHRPARRPRSRTSSAGAWSSVFVNGVQVWRDGRHTGATPGRALRRP